MQSAVPDPAIALDAFDQGVLEIGRRTAEVEIAGLVALRESLNSEFIAAAKLLMSVRGRVIIGGIGKSGHVAAKIAATLTSTGTPAHFIHATEAAHGDMGVITRDDVVILISNSGATPELTPIIQHAARLRIGLIGISSAADSNLMRNATVRLLLPPAPEACPAGVAPTTSTTMTLALGDALAMAVMEKRGFSRDDFRLLHPGGHLGLRLMKVSEIMHRGDRLPLVRPDTPMPEVIMTMTSKSFGIAGVVDERGALQGVVTDGDLRRHADRLSDGCAVDVMTADPRTIEPAMLAQDALSFMNATKVTALFVVDSSNGEAVPVGLVGVHDFLRLGLS